MKDKINAILGPIGDLIHRKNTDYGNSYALLREEFGPTSFHIRLADKVHRIKQIDNNGALVASETALDTIRDIIGYCALEILYREGSQ